MDKYVVQVEKREELKNRFSYHPPIDNQPERYADIRDKFYLLAVFLCTNCPESRELSTALTLLDQANMMANASIARNE